MKLFSVTILSGLLTFLNMVKGFLISKVVAIYAGPEGVAIMGQLQSFVAAINGLVSNQIGQGIARFTAQNGSYGQSPSLYWRAATKLLVYILCLVTPVFIIFSSQLANWLIGSTELYWIIVLLMVFLPLNICNSFLLSVLNGKEEHLKYITSLMLSTVASTIMAILLIYLYGINGGLAAVALNNALAGLIVIARVYKADWFKLKHWFGQTDAEKITVMSKYMALGVVGALTGPMSLIFVRETLENNISLAAAGNWQLMWSISTAFISVLTTAVGVFYYPKLAKSRYFEHLTSDTLKVFILIIPLALIGAGMIYFIRVELITLLATEEFKYTEELFGVQLLGDLVRILSYIPALLLMAKGYFKMNALCEIIASLNFAMISYFLIPELGIIGASYAHLINYAVYFLVVSTVFIIHLRKMDRFSDVKQQEVASI